MLGAPECLLRNLEHSESARLAAADAAPSLLVILVVRDRYEFPLQLVALSASASTRWT